MHKNTSLYFGDKNIMCIHSHYAPWFVVCPVDGAAAELLRDDVRRTTGS